MRSHYFVSTYNMLESMKYISQSKYKEIIIPLEDYAKYLMVHIKKSRYL